MGTLKSLLMAAIEVVSVSNVIVQYNICVHIKSQMSNHLFNKGITL